jgi:MOSC domain-containing protein YiiM
LTAVSVNRGAARPHPAHPEEGQTGIYKQPVDHIVVSPVGVVDDSVCDRRHHGSPSKAVCVFCADHFPSLAQRHPELAWTAGAFGENLTVSGLDEQKACLGDVFKVGEAVLQISQPRGPCGTLAARHGLPHFVRECIEFGHTGWYCRCLRPGVIRAGDTLKRVNYHLKGVSVAEANETRYDESAPLDDILRLLSVDALSDEWRTDLMAVWQRRVTEGS